MECGSNYASGFLKYLSDFVANIRPDDPLPVRAPSYKVTESEIDGQILDIVHHYLNSRECPPYVREYVGHRVWSAIRNPGLNGDGDDQVDAANTTNHTYDAMKLIQEVTAKANTVIREMQANLTVEEVEKLPRYHPISHFAIKNTRRKMEDRHVIIPDLNTLYGMEYQSPHAYYGVFDGHAGTDAAVYSAAHLHQYMIQNPQYETNPEAALKHAFHITDTNFIKKATKERLKGGTTAVVALVREKRLVVAWLGDSQALLVRRRNPVRMVEPHKPELPVERERVEEMGGCVINIQGTWRVLGQLAVSRAIGDVDYKPYVSSECDIKSLEIEGDEDFLILACDGLWDTLTPEAAVNVVYAYLTHNDGDTDGVGRCLVEAARNAGSEDNITAVVVFLRPVATLMEEEAQRIAQGQVPDPVPANIIYKDTTPSSINAIFSPPINQFEYSTPTTPPFNPFESDEPVGAGPYDAKVGMATEGALTPATLDFNKDGDEPMEGSEAPRNLGQDSDSDEGIAGGAEGGPEPAFNPHDAPTPTAEEVDAALAELDSIPDGVCEAGDVEEEEEDEEEWSYFRMEPQTQPQGEDVLVPGGPTAPVALPSETPQSVDAVIDDESIVTAAQKSPSHENLLTSPMEAAPQDQVTGEVYSEKIPSPYEADQPPVMENPPDILQASVDEGTIGFESSARTLDLMQTSMDKVPDLMEGNFEQPSSPHGSVSPRVPGSPRSVEGFVTSVELNTPEENFGTNFAINQNQDSLTGAMEQPSGPFSVYVSSSPEPSSLEPSLQAPVDLVNFSGIANGQVEEESSQVAQDSPVEIVHAQSTVEVVAPPSPVDIAGSETQFIIPEHETGQINADMQQPSDITFVPEKAVEPVAEVPVSVFVDESTPVSEPDTADLLGQEVVSPAVESPLTPVESSPAPVEELISPVEVTPAQEEPTPAPVEPTPAPVEPTPAPVEPTPAPVEPTPAPVEPTPAPVEPTPAPVEPTPAPVEPTPAPVEPTPAPVEPTPAPVEPTPVPVEPTPAPVEPTPAPVEDKLPSEPTPEKVETPAPAAAVPAKAAPKTGKEGAPTPKARTPAKTTKAPATKATPDKKPTPGRATPARPTPGKATPTRTPISKTPTPKATEKTASPKPSPRVALTKPAADKPTATKPGTARPASARPTATRPATGTAGATRPAATKPLAKKPAEKPATTTSTTTKAPATRPTTGAPRPGSARPTPAARTTTTSTVKKTAPTKTADKPDAGKLVNGSATRTTTTARRPLTQTASKTSTTRPAAEKETKNTTNRILSTTRPASKPGTTTTTRPTVSRTAAAAKSSTTESKTTSRLDATTKARTSTTTKSAATKTAGVAVKKTLVSKTKTAGTKTAATKAEKSEATVLETSEPVVNGENKIADEETSVEVIEKCAVEDIMKASSEKVITESSQTMTTSEQVVVTTETTEVIVNGDH